jgi:hypothetical protein
MEHSLDSYFWNINSNEFLYDNRRICSKLYIFFKFIGLIFYGSILPTCNNHDFFIGMIVAMFLSVINSMRYEYAHFKRYGTIFSSINEFEEWKKELYPRSRILFSIVEISIKIVYFINTFPPVCEFRNLCQICESIFKIHVIALLMIYIIAFVSSICFLCSCYRYDNSHRHQTISLPIQILVINTQNEECCICMDIGNTSWTILPCGHKFHGHCISIWLHTNQTCPICRLYIS